MKGGWERGPSGDCSSNKYNIPLHTGRGRIIDGMCWNIPYILHIIWIPALGLASVTRFAAFHLIYASASKPLNQCICGQDMCRQRPETLKDKSYGTSASKWVKGHIMISRCNAIFGHHRWCRTMMMYCTVYGMAIDWVQGTDRGHIVNPIKPKRPRSRQRLAFAVWNVSLADGRLILNIY